MINRHLMIRILSFPDEVHAQQQQRISQQQQAKRASAATQQSNALSLLTRAV
jgi:hypothetical protein